jgi:hypothetical protein
MAMNGTPTPRKRRIWRISPDAPLGRFVDPDEVPQRVEPAEPEERYEPGWRQSSFDLAFGLEVREAGDTVPGDLLDELFKNPAR